MSWYVASLAINIRARCPTFLEKPAAFSLALVFPAVFDKIAHLLPAVLLATRSL